MNALFGYTGFVGSNILKFKEFDKLYRSNNIIDAKHQSFNEVYFASLPGTKWLANKYYDNDNDIINQCIDILSTITCNKFVLISTIDIYDNISNEYTEDSNSDITILHKYGEHRLIFENFIKNKFNNYYIFRLPALFGDGLKKNILYDLINNNEVYKINLTSTYQWYNLDWLETDFNICFKNNIKICNFFTEPINTLEVCKLFQYCYIDNYKYNTIHYNSKTKYCNYWNKHNGYIYSKMEVLISIRNFINKETKKDKYIQYNKDIDIIYQKSNHLFYPLIDKYKRILFTCINNNIVCNNIINEIEVNLNEINFIYWKIHTDSNAIKKYNKTMHMKKNYLFFNVESTWNMGHSLAAFYNYLGIVFSTIHDYWSANFNEFKLCMFKDKINYNITLIIDKIFRNKVYYLDENTNYIFDNLYLVKNNKPSIYNNENIVVSNLYPPEIKKKDEINTNTNNIDKINNIQIQYYGDSLYFCKPFILKYVNDNYKRYPIYNKISILKKNTHNRLHQTGCINNESINIILQKGYHDIDPYKYDLLEIIWYIRNSKYIIISCGNALYTHMPFFIKDQIINVLVSGVEICNLRNEYIINKTNNNELIHSSEYHTHSYFYLRFLEKTTYHLLHLNKESLKNTDIKFL